MIKCGKTEFEKTLNSYTTKFQAVRNSPVFYLQSLPTKTLEIFMTEMKRENRECLSSLHWLEGIIKLREKDDKNSL